MIYLDHNASSPADPRVVDAMLPWLGACAANASSVDHAAGHAAAQAVEQARRQVAELVGARPAEVVFTSGATEADNMAVLGVLAGADQNAEIVVSAVEHPAVLEPARRWGARLRVAPVDGEGLVDPDALAAMLGERTALVSVMAANNETGAIQPIAEIADLCLRAEVPLHVDAAQAAGRIPIEAELRHAALISVSGHKMHGPMGIGALIVRRMRPRARLTPLLAGGGQEHDLRPGTLNVPGIVGFGCAAEIVRVERDAEANELARLRDLLLERLQAAGLHPERNGPEHAVLPQTLNVRLPGINARAVLRLLAGRLAISTGSACSTTSVQPSHVLLAMGRTPQQAAESLRLSLGRTTTAGEVEEAARLIAEAAERLSALALAG